MENSIILRFHSSNPKLKQVNYLGRTPTDQKAKYYSFIDLFGTELGENNKFVFHETDKKFNKIKNIDIHLINNIEWYRGGVEFDNDFRRWLIAVLQDRIIGE